MPLRVATDCSGIETPLVVLRRIGIPFRHLFSSDTSPRCRAYIRANFAPERLFDSVFDRPTDWPETIDLYVAGPPCTAASTLNVAQDEKTRDAAYEVGRNCIDFIATSRPFAFIIENVPKLRSVRKGRVLADWMSAIPGNAYDVDYRCLNAKDYGCPQNRNRLFVVGVRRDNPHGWSLRFPTTMPLLTTATDLLDQKAPSHRPLAPWEIKALNALNPHPEAVLNMSTVGMCVRLGSLWKQRDPRLSNCLTFRHPDMYSVKRGRRLFPHEYARLQGFRDGEIDLNTPSIMKLIGNAMNANVICEVIKTLLSVDDQVCT